jgi:hypothetical protein
MESMSKYVRLTKSKYEGGTLVPADKVNDYITGDKQHYVSTYFYDKAHYDKFQTTKSVKGFTGVTTNKIWFDFDSKDEIEKARFDTLEVISRLKASGIKEENIQIYFSGNKGYNIIVELNRELTQQQAQSIATNKFAKNLQTFDQTLYDGNQILRVPGTKHEVSGLFKIPLTQQEIQEMTSDEIKLKAKSLDNVGDFDWNPAIVSEEFVKVEEAPKAEKIATIASTLEHPRSWKDYKWSLLQGNFKVGERHHALMVLAATCRGLGYDETLATAMLKTADQKHCLLTGDRPCGDLESNIIPSVYTDSWKGGQYSPESDAWLKKYCEREGFSTSKEKNHIVTTEDIFSVFQKYSVDFEKNIVKTGIAELDDNVMFLTSTHNGILGQPGAGKTSLMLQWLEECSKNDIPGLFYSLDMGAPMIYGKIFQRELGVGFREATQIMRNEPKRALETQAIIREKYKNIKFNFRSGITPGDMKKDIHDLQEKTGKKVKFLGVDYLECVQGPFSDALANSGHISQAMKDLANEEELMSAMLLQTQKHSTTDVSDPLQSMKQVKGSSVIEQASSVILTLWREGYNPNTVNDDRYISFAAVKNRFGGLWTGDFGWEGKKGLIRALADNEHEELEKFKEYKKEQRAAAKAEKDSWT